MADPRTLGAGVNTNPMLFEDLATSLSSLASYARGDMAQPFADMNHLYTRALQEAPSYKMLSALAGYNSEGPDHQRGRAAWLLANVAGVDVYGVHTRVWHKVQGKFSAPILDQASRVLGVPAQLNDQQIQEIYPNVVFG